MKFIKTFENQKFVSVEELTDTNTYWYYKNPVPQMEQGSILHCLEKKGFGHFDFIVYYFKSNDMKRIELNEELVKKICFIDGIELRPATKKELEEFEYYSTVNKYNL